MHKSVSKINTLNGLPGCLSTFNHKGHNAHGTKKRRRIYTEDTVWYSTVKAIIRNIFVNLTI